MSVSWTDFLGAPTADRRSAETDASAIDTNELRWFAPGPLPAIVQRWFSGAARPTEQRRDRYLLDGRTGRGVKLRHGETLELKVRLGRNAPRRRCAELPGAVEAWRKWVLADGLVDPPTALRWVDVDKTIFKRRFRTDGTEVDFVPELDGSSGCDVEIVGVRVGPVEAWSFAFAAFGRSTSRCDSIAAAWDAVRSDADAPAELRLEHRCCMGYPEWLDRTIEPSSSE